MSQKRRGRNWDVALFGVLAIEVAYMFWIGYGPTQGIVAGSVMLVVTLIVGVVWNRSAEVRAFGGHGDERDRMISTRAQAATGRVLSAALLGLVFGSVLDREVDTLILTLASMAFLVYAGSLAYFARQV